MDFDLSKENIQPLRGGRNVSQLEAALQAQTDVDHQKELLLQREEFEKLIRTYTGEDPLDNWYRYISWVEQSYPKQGHEGNLLNLLEHCLKIFESDERYRDDSRLCKLFVKYIDQQQNPIELYHMMYARGLCRHCTEMYKAWAYYYEAAGDFRNAHKVFECGKREFAQPYTELQNAHENLVVAAGRHIIYGPPNEQDLLEKRQALTSLVTYKSGLVASLRKGSNSKHGLHGVSPTLRSNVSIPVYEDKGDEVRIEEIGPISIVKAAKRQEVPKENTLKPGPWMTIPVDETKHSQRQISCFTVHEDSGDLTVQPRLTSFVPATLENYSNWIVSLTIPEPKDDRMIPMYPKEKVYSEISTENSLEELRAARYINHGNYQHLSPTILHKATENINPTTTFKNIQEQLHNISEKNMTKVEEENGQSPGSRSFQQLRSTNDSFLEDNFNISNFDLWNTPNRNILLSPTALTKCSASKFSIYEQSNVVFHGNIEPKEKNNTKVEDEKGSQSPGSRSFQQLRSPNDSFSENNYNVSNFDLWDTPNRIFLLSPTASKKCSASKFSIYEQSNLLFHDNIEPKGSAMKTPFNNLTAEELAETGSRGGMDIAAAAPVDSAKRLPLYDDNCISFAKNSEGVDFEDCTCNTQLFGFDLNVMQVSTPQNKPGDIGKCEKNCSKITAKQLFSETIKEGDKHQKILPTIFEETKSYGQCSSGSSSNVTTKSALFNNNTKQNSMTKISEEHNSYLAQNLKANAALRSSSLGDLMDFCHSSSLTSRQKTPANEVAEVPKVADITPLNFVPSDPFKHSLIEQLLEMVHFPGFHTKGFLWVNNIPKLSVRKETVYIGSDKYVIDKQLGKGTYGTVFRGIDVRTGNTIAMKIQKPANKWEFYICRELQARLVHHPLREHFMDVKIGYFSDQASVLISDFMPCGSLLDVANTIKQKSGRPMKESLCIHFCLEMLKIVHAMHEVNIIHADIKPDNFLVHLFRNDIVGLQLIDFGCSIDMSLFPPGASFTRKVTTEDFICCEMKDNRRWNYHTDLFCIAATAHVLLFEKYIQMQKKDGHWSILNRLPRYARLDLWNMFFSTLLNQQDGAADSMSLQAMLEDSLNHKFDDYHNELRYLTNILKNR